jgi:hypothetical protein
LQPLGSEGLRLVRERAANERKRDEYFVSCQYTVVCAVCIRLSLICGVKKS